jgi:hypothetical protein
VAIAAVAMSALSACGAYSAAPTAVPTPDMFASWSDRPLPPDPNLTAKMLDPVHGCQLGMQGAAPNIILQDRRTESTAAFLVSDRTVFGMCLGNAAGTLFGAAGNPIVGMTGSISIDDQNQADAGNGQTVFWLSGRVAAGATQVRITLTDGRAVTASLWNGYWLAWWPINANAARVAASDAAGKELGSLAVTE